jgi:glycosyltransferase involved in cell wall biosynthesis
MRATAVVPAYNEASRIGRVLAAVESCSLVDQLIVVDDGSRDDTAAAAGRHNGAEVVRLPRNQGKAAAMWEGVARARNKVVVFVDADLVGLTPEHVAELVRPVLSGEADMTVGQFSQAPPWITYWMRLMPAISGQRAMRVSDFVRVPNLVESGFGVEVALTRYALRKKLRTRYVPLSKMTHVIKEEKRGILRGVSSRAVMYYQMTRAALSNGYHQLAEMIEEHGPTEQ